MKRISFILSIFILICPFNLLGDEAKTISKSFLPFVGLKNKFTVIIKINNPNKTFLIDDFRIQRAVYNQLQRENIFPSKDINNHIISIIAKLTLKKIPEHNDILCNFEFSIKEPVKLKRITDKYPNQTLPVTIWYLSTTKIVPTLQLDITAEQTFADMTREFVHRFKKANNMKIKWKYLR